MLLRIVHNRQYAYQRRHHRKIGQRAGVTKAEIARIGDVTSDKWTERERAMFAAIDQLGAQRSIDDHVWASLSAHLSEPELVELLMLSGQYESLTTTIMTIGIEPD